jgi:hypothetical protein
LKQPEYGIHSLGIVKNEAKGRKMSVFLKPLILTGDNNLINQLDCTGL